MNAAAPRPATPEHLVPTSGPREPATPSPSLRRIGRATLIAATISALANVALATALRIGLGIDPVFRPLSQAGVAVLTFAFTCIGGVVFAVIAHRWPSDAVRRFTIVAIVVLIGSLAAPLSLLAATQAQHARCLDDCGVCTGTPPCRRGDRVGGHRPKVLRMRFVTGS